MANNLAIGLVIGAALSSGFKSSFGSAKSAIENLGKAINKSQQNHQKLGGELSKLRQKQAELYAHMSRSSSKGSAGLALIKREYDQIAKKISQVKAKQQAYTKAIERSIHTQSKLKKAIGSQEANNRFRENQKNTFSSNFVKGTAIAATGWGTVKTFIEQEEAATNLKIAMMRADGSIGKFKEIGKIADNLGRDLPGTKKDFYNLAQALKKQGLSDDILTGGALKTSAELNVLLDMDQQSGGEFLAKFMESHRLSETELPQAADYLQRAMFAGGLSREQMYESMKYYAPKLNSMKLTGAENTEKVLAIEAMAGQQGLEGSTFGTGLNMMLSRMNKGPEMIRAATKGMKAEAREMMKASGVEFNFWDKKGSFKGIDGMLQEMTKFEKIRAKFGDKGVGLVAEELFGIEGGRLADILAQKGSKGLDEMLTKMREQASLQDRIAVKTSTLGAALESLGGVWETAVGEVGSVFAKDIKNLANTFQEAIEEYTPLIAKHKETIKVIAGAVAGFTVFKLALSGVAVLASTALAPFLSLYAGFQRLQTVTEAFRLWKMSKDFSVFGNAVRKTGGAIGRSAQSLLQFAKHTSSLAFNGAINSFKLLRTATISSLNAMKIGVVTAFKASWRGLTSIANSVANGFHFIARGALNLGRVLGGALMQGVMIVGRAFMWLGRALLTNPIGLIITGIAVAAYLIYDNWGAIAPWFANLWQNITAYFNQFCTWVQGLWNGAIEWVANAWGGVTSFFSDLWTNIGNFFSNGISNLGSLILAFNPLSLFQSIFSTVLSWFGIDMPAKFAEFGSNIINGLVNGIRDAWNGAKAWIIELGQSIKGWFTGEMKIHSPSRVFKAYGVNIVEGLAIGMDKSLPLAENATQHLVDSTAFKPALNPVEMVFKPVLAPLLDEEKDWFAKKQDIHSPSRVFKGYGVNVVEGLAIGMDKSLPPAENATQHLVDSTAFKPALNPIETIFKPILGEKKGFFGALWDDVKFGANFIGNLLGLHQPTDFRTPDFNPNTKTDSSSILHDYQPLNRNSVTQNETNQQSVVVHFNPTINMNGNANSSLTEQVQQGLNMSLVEFERLLNRVLDQRQRRAY